MTFEDAKYLILRHTVLLGQDDSFQKVEIQTTEIQLNLTKIF